MSKIFYWVMGAMLVALGALTLLYGYEKHAATKAKADMAVYQEAATTLSEQLETAHKSFRFDLDAINSVHETKGQIEKRTTEVKEKVDAVAKKVKAGELSSDAADAAYLDSMWETYCQRQDHPSCASRRDSR